MDSEGSRLKKSSEQAKHKPKKKKARKIDWGEGLFRWTAFQAEHFNGIVPADYHDKALLEWVEDQRKDYWRLKAGKTSFLDEHGFGMLERRGFDWGSSPTKDNKEGKKSKLKKRASSSSHQTPEKDKKKTPHLTPENDKKVARKCHQEEDSKLPAVERKNDNKAKMMPSTSAVHLSVEHPQRQSSPASCPGNLAAEEHTSIRSNCSGEINSKNYYTRTSTEIEIREGEKRNTPTTNQSGQGKSESNLSDQSKKQSIASLPLEESRRRRTSSKPNAAGNASSISAVGQATTEKAAAAAMAPPRISDKESVRKEPSGKAEKRKRRSELDDLLPGIDWNLPAKKTRGAQAAASEAAAVTAKYLVTQRRRTNARTKSVVEKDDDNLADNFAPSVLASDSVEDPDQDDDFVRGKTRSKQTSRRGSRNSLGAVAEELKGIPAPDVAAHTQTASNEDLSSGLDEVTKLDTEKVRMKTFSFVDLPEFEHVKLLKNVTPPTIGRLVPRKDEPALLEQVKHEFANVLESGEPLIHKKGRGSSLLNVQANLIWEQHFFEFLMFKKVYGHGRVPTTFPENTELAGWCAHNRECRKKSYEFLTESRISRLNAVGFEWDETSSSGTNGKARKKGSLKLDLIQAKWDGMIARLLQFKESYGHVAVPRRYTKDMTLAEWTYRQRALLKRYMSGDELAMPKNRVDTLIEIGFPISINRQLYPMVEIKRKEKEVVPKTTKLAKAGNVTVPVFPSPIPGDNSRASRLAARSEKQLAAIGEERKAISNGIPANVKEKEEQTIVDDDGQVTVETESASSADESFGDGHKGENPEGDNCRVEVESSDIMGKGQVIVKESSVVHDELLTKMSGSLVTKRKTRQSSSETNPDIESSSCAVCGAENFQYFVEAQNHEAQCRGMRNMEISPTALLD